MAELTDHELLTDFARTGNEAAFATLVQRHVNLVWSAARRFTNDDTLAEETTQAVFIILARKAGKISRKTILTGWLYQTARLTAANAIKEKLRRQKREQEAYMESTLNQPETGEAWQQIAPVLDEAMNALRTADRDAVLLRYFENKPLTEVGAALGVSEDAARVRVNRALDKLRALLAKQGVKFGVTLLATTVVENSVKAAPAALVKTISAVAVGKGTAAGASTGALVKVALKALAWNQYKGLVTYTTAALTVGTAFVVAVSEPSAKPAIKVSPQTNVVAEIREPLSDATTFCLHGYPGSVAVQSDGKVVLGSCLYGFFADTNSGMVGLWSRGALRLNPDGTLDRTFLCNVQSSVYAAQQAKVDLIDNGEILISGRFDSIDSIPRPGFAMLQPNGKLDGSFQPWTSLTTNMPAYTFRQSGFYPTARLLDGSLVMASAPLQTKSNFLYTATVFRTGPDRKWIQESTNLLAGTFSRPSGLINTLSPVGFLTRPPIQWSNDAPATPRPPIRYGYDLLTGADTPPRSGGAF